MQRRHGLPALVRRAASVAVAALVLSVAGMGLAPRVPADGGAAALYGQVVDVSPTAIVLSLPNDNNAWVALNLTAQTVVTAQDGGTAAPPMATGDWVVATYTVSRQGGDGRVAVWLVARTVTYSMSPISTSGRTVHLAGKVVGLTPSGFTMRVNDGELWTVTVEPGTNVLLGGTAVAISLLQVGDPVQVWGAAEANVIVASRVVYRVSGKHDNGKPRHGPHH